MSIVRFASVLGVKAIARHGSIHHFAIHVQSPRVVVCRALSSSSTPQKIKFRFLEESSGDLIEVEGEEGQTVLEVALKHDINIEGACGGELACSTCHVIVQPELFKKLPAKKVEEEDMLDLAWGMTDT